MSKRYKAELKANLRTADPRGWVQHSDYHWSRTIGGSRLHYWPSQKKWRFCGVTQTGDVQVFIERLTSEDSTERRSSPRGNPATSFGQGMYGTQRTMVVRIPCEALERVAAICREYELEAPARRSTQPRAPSHIGPRLPETV